MIELNKFSIDYLIAKSKKQVLKLIQIIIVKISNNI